MHIYRAVESFKVIAKRLLNQLPAAEDQACFPDKSAQQLEFDRCQTYRFFSDSGFSFLEVDHQVAMSYLGLAAIGVFIRQSAEDGAYSGGQFFRAEWFYHIVVCAKVKTG